jgi:hypothetical protein
MHRCRMSFLTLLALGVAQSAMAFGPQGHRTAGAIADRLLTPKTRAAVERLLLDDRDKFGALSHRTTLEAVSTWADEIRGTSSSHPQWHYDNAPACGTAPKARYCPEGQCNTEQLRRLTAVLADARASARERNEALKWIVHLVADIHQPLHAADNSDRGGSEVRVALAGVRTRGRASLHGVWDNELVQLAFKTRGRQKPPAEIEALTGQAERLRKAAGQGDPSSWAAESHRLALDVAYHYPEFACGEVPPRIVVLSPEYQRVALPVVRDRVLLAGARLAGLLNRVLTTTP